MRGLRTGLVLLLLVASVVATARLTLRAQEREASGLPLPRTQGPRGETRETRRDPLLAKPEAATSPISVQDALQRPFTFPFAEPTTLADVCQFLRRELQAPVVLDLAALDRLDLKADDAVQLQLESVRLKTGLKLLLDQVGLTYDVIAEDNLLVLTDQRGAKGPIEQVLSELKSLHRDIHDLQDAVDDIQWLLGDAEGEGARVRKPTMIEEMPAEQKPDEKPEAAPPGAADRPRPRRG